MLLFIPKLVCIVKILNCENCNPRTTTAARRGVQNLTLKYEGKMFKKNSNSSATIFYFTMQAFLDRVDSK